MNNAIEYRGFHIFLSETAQGVQVSNTPGSDFTVSRKDGIVYLASSSLGSSFAMNGSDALLGAQKLIDQALYNK